MNKFDIPVVLFIFKREKAVEIIKRLSIVKPTKLYILADQGRDDIERKAVKKCREKVEAAIDWECEVIKKVTSGRLSSSKKIAHFSFFKTHLAPSPIF